MGAEVMTTFPTSLVTPALSRGPAFSRGTDVAGPRVEPGVTEFLR